MPVGGPDRSHDLIPEEDILAEVKRFRLTSRIKKSVRLASKNKSEAIQAKETGA